MEPAPGPVSLACPGCQQLDHVQKVSGVVAAGVSSGAFAGVSTAAATAGGGASESTHVHSHTTLHGSTATGLSQLLALPKPAREAGSGPLAIALLLCCAAVVCGFWALISFAGGDPLQGVIAAGAAAGLLWFVCVLSKEMAAAGEEAARRAEADWAPKHAVWEQLFYCHRCHGVYVRGDAAITPATQMRDMIDARARAVPAATGDPTA